MDFPVFTTDFKTTDFTMLTVSVMMGQDEHKIKVLDHEQESCCCLCCGSDSCFWYVVCDVETQALDGRDTTKGKRATRVKCDVVEEEIVLAEGGNWLSWDRGTDLFL